MEALKIDYDLNTNVEKFIVTGPASEEFKSFTKENGFVIEYRNSIDGFLR